MFGFLSIFHALALRLCLRVHKVLQSYSLLSSLPMWFPSWASRTTTSLSQWCLCFPVFFQLHWWKFYVLKIHEVVFCYTHHMKCFSQLRHVTYPSSLRAPTSGVKQLTTFSLSTISSDHKLRSQGCLPLLHPSLSPSCLPCPLTASGKHFLLFQQVQYIFSSTYRWQNVVFTVMLLALCSYPATLQAHPHCCK